MAATFLISLGSPLADAGAAQHPKCFGKRATITSTSKTTTGTARPDVIVVKRNGGATVYGRGGDDRICGGNAGDRIFGGLGNDRLQGGAGADRMVGGPGKDRFLLTVADHADAVAGESVNGHVRSVVARPRERTVHPPRSDVIAARTNSQGRQILDLAAGASVPQHGAIVVLPVTNKTPEGVLGRVLSIKRRSVGRTRLILVPATLDSAYTDYSVSASGTLANTGTTGSRAAQPRALNGNFDCTSGSGIGPTVEVALDLSKLHFLVELQTRSPYLQVMITGQPILSMNLAFHGQVTCSAKKSVPVLVPIPGTPLTVHLRPEFSFTVDAGLQASATWSPHIAYGFIRSAKQGNSDFKVFRNDGGIEFRGQASLEAFLGLNMELALAGRVGVGGTIGPVLTGAVGASPERCFTVIARFRGQLTASADVFFKSWTFALATVTFGDAELFRRCSSQGAGGGGSGTGGGSGGGGGGSTSPPSSTPMDFSGPFASLSIGSNLACALRTNGSVACWGPGSTAGPYNQMASPTGSFSAIDIGFSYGCGIRTDETLSCWGSPSNPALLNPPPGTFKRVSAGGSDACAIRTDDTLICWGENRDGMMSPPTGKFDRISAGDFNYACAVSDTGALSCWGSSYDRSFGEPAPGGSFVDVQTGYYVNCASRINGEVNCWHTSGSPGKSEAAPGTFDQFSLNTFACGVMTGGQLRCWGLSNYHQPGAPPPDGTFTQVATGSASSCALRLDASILCWRSPGA